VRRSGHTIRITAQLNNAVTGYQLWSQTYDRDLGDVLKLQTDIANAVANSLRVTLLGDVAAKIELGGTHSPAAFDAYLRASNAYRHFGPANLAAGGLNTEGLQSAVTAYTEAIRADPDYALAYAGRSLAFADFARALVAGPEVGDYFNKAEVDARERLASRRISPRPTWRSPTSSPDLSTCGRVQRVRACAGARARQCNTIERVWRVRRAYRPN